MEQKERASSCPGQEGVATGGAEGGRGPMVAGDLSWVQGTLRTGRRCRAGKPRDTANQNHLRSPSLHQDSYNPNTGEHHVLA